MCVYVFYQVFVYCPREFGFVCLCILYVFVWVIYGAADHGVINVSLAQLSIRGRFPISLYVHKSRK